MTENQDISVFWFRRDLRLDDNKGLVKALASGLPVLCLFIFDRAILDKLADKDDARLSFIYHAVERIKKGLRKRGSDISVIYDTPAKAFEKVFEEYNVKSVFANEDYEPYARQRDSQIKELLGKHKIPLDLSPDQCIFAPGLILKPGGDPYTIFTPYKNKWLARLAEITVKTNPMDSGEGNFLKTGQLELPSLESMGFIFNDREFPGSDYRGMLEQYGKTRDYPALDATSRIGIHLRFGTLNVRKLLLDAQTMSPEFTNELVWREFYFQILWFFPHVADHSFKPAYDRIQWLNNESDFGRWCRGETGFAMVDAGMRQLNSTGFIHNRLRMIAASFLCKDLLIDWRWGEAYFARRLLDFELSSNNGGWQWAAGTGCDAAPYFRIFNPLEQQKKFDPDLSFIRKWVPEFQELRYTPMVDHKFARDRCLKVYKEALTGASG